MFFISIPNIQVLQKYSLYIVKGGGGSGHILLNNTVSQVPFGKKSRYNFAKPKTSGIPT